MKNSWNHLHPFQNGPLHVEQFSMTRCTGSRFNIRMKLVGQCFLRDLHSCCPLAEFIKWCISALWLHRYQALLNILWKHDLQYIVVVIFVIEGYASTRRKHWPTNFILMLNREPVHLVIEKCSTIYIVIPILFFYYYNNNRST
jgi:hypothetical protein